MTLHVSSSSENFVLNISLLSDPLLLLIMALAAFFGMATSLQVATRPAAVRTGLVATALTMGQLIFIVTRFGNLFYLPLLGNFVDQATRSGDTDILVQQISWVIIGTALGAVAAALLLPTFVELSCLGVRSIDRHKSLLKALFNLRRFSTWRRMKSGFRRPGLLGVRLFKFEGIPKTFLLFNIVATSIWSVGALAAITVSGLQPEVKQTALLLSGLVNSFAAIAFSIWVDPQAAHITDQAKDGRLKESHVCNASVHLIAGNFIGSLLGVFLLKPAVFLIGVAATAIGDSASELQAATMWLIAGNALILLLNGTIYSSRVSAVRTAKVATALAVFNFFSLISRVAGQVYGPFVGAVTDQLTHRGPGEVLGGEALESLELFNRGLIGGATVGCLLSVLMIPSFVRIYDAIIMEMDKHGELSKVIRMALHPKRWPTIAKTFRAPWKQHVSRAALARLPKGFLYGNVLVLTFVTVGQLAAIYAGAALAPEVARTATLLSPLINGIATITLSVLVDPSCATIVDDTIKGERTIDDVETMTFWLAIGSVIGTLLAQLLFLPAAWFIGKGAQLLGALLEMLAR